MGKLTIERLREMGREFAFELLTDLPQDQKHRVLNAFTVQELLHGISDEARMKGMSDQDRMKGMSDQDRLKGMSAQDRLKGMSVQDILNSLSPERRADLLKVIKLEHGKS